MIVTEEKCKNAINDIKMYSGINIPPNAFDTIEKLIELHFNNSLNFKHFIPYSDTYLRSSRFKKNDLIDYIHTLYYNWQASDRWYEKVAQENKKLLEEKSKLESDVNNYRFDKELMELTIKNLCDHFEVKNIKELQQIYLKRKGDIRR